MKDLKFTAKKDGCHICSYWSALNGCEHYGPQDYSKNEEIIKAIVAGVHGNKKIIETSDFYAGINATLICLRENNLICEPVT